MNLQQAKEKYEIIDRLTSEMPDFWKPIRNYSAILFVLATAASTTIASMGLAVPVWLTIILTASGAISGAATLTKK